MSTPDHAGHRGESKSGFLSSRMGFVLIGFLIIAGALLFTEHRAHVLGVLLYLPLFACVLMHFFMHGGHHHHSGDDGKKMQGSET